MNQDTVTTLFKLFQLGLEPREVTAIYKAAWALLHWSQITANGHVVRGPMTGKPYAITLKESQHWEIPDSEALAKQQLDQILAQHPQLAYYVTGTEEPPLVIYAKLDLPMGVPISQVYSQVGVPIFPLAT